LHLAFTQGLLAKLVADTATTELRGSAFGVFHLVSGIALLLASVVAGVLWSSFGAPATFLAGAGFSAVAAVGLIAFRVQRPRSGGRRFSMGAASRGTRSPV
jgi:MFS family permease